MKCNRCTLAIDPTKDAFVVMPNPEQCGKGAFRPTRHAHASCFERDVKAAYKQEMEADAEREREIEEARGHHSFGATDSAEWWRSIAQGLGVKLYASNDAIKLGLEALEGTSAIDVLEVMAIMREATATAAEGQL